jgi:hypothetical protein
MNEKEITSYADYREYEKAHKARSKWSKANDYAVYTWSMCSECIYFRISPELPIHGDCELMKQDGVYPGVMAKVICDRFVSDTGLDITGKVVIPSRLPAWAKTYKTETGETRLEIHRSQEPPGPYGPK